MVLAREAAQKSYATAYFEAFPATGSGFIRGEGSTVKDAEDHALRQRRKELACPDHRISRGTYTNGSGICRKCGAWQSKVFPEIVVLGAWAKPASGMTLSRFFDESMLRFMILDPHQNPKRVRESVLRCRLAGMRVPDFERNEGWVSAALDAARIWARTERADPYLAPRSQECGLEGVFSSLAYGGLQHHIREARGEA